MMKLLVLLTTFSLLKFGLFGQTETKQVEKFPNQETAFDQLAEFPGGKAALNQFIASNFIYPKIAIENNISGKVYVVFQILATGEVSNIKIEKGIPDCYECSEEAIRVLKSMPKWSPAMLSGKPVGCFYKLPITITNN